MRIKFCRAFIILLAVSFSGSILKAQNASKGISFQAVIKNRNGQLPNVTGTTVLLKVLSPNDCILREEIFSGVNINSGYLNLVIGHGTPTSNNPEPARDLSAVMNNSANISGLTCLAPDGSVNSSKTTYEPQKSDTRKLRISLQIDQDVVVADFNMRAIAYAVNAESLNGKIESDFINTNSAKGLTQNNLENIFQRYTQLNSILNGTFAGEVVGNVSGTASNITGVVGVSNGGTGATSASAARANLGLKGLAMVDLPLHPDTTKFLRSDGTWAAVVGGVSSVAGRTGNVVITTTDLSDFGTSSEARALAVINAQKGQVNGLPGLDASGKIANTYLALTESDIPNLNASKLNSGTLTVNVNSSLVNAGSGQFTQLRINDGSGKVLTMTRQAGGTDYAIQWPANVGASNSVLHTDTNGILSWKAIPSAPVVSVAGKTGAVNLLRSDIGDLGTAAALDAGFAMNNLVQLDSSAKIPSALLPNSVITNSTIAGGDLTGTYPNPSIASNTITSSKIADGAVGALSKVVSVPGSSGPNRFLATDTGSGTTIKDFYCTTVGHYLQWTGIGGFGCVAISSANIVDATQENTANKIVKRDSSGNFSAGTISANLTGNVTGSLIGNVIGDVDGVVKSKVENKVVNYTIQASDRVVTGDASSSNLSFTLPSASTMPGREFVIKKIDSSNNTVNIVTSGSEKIDGLSNLSINRQWDYVTIISNGQNWLVIGGNVATSSSGTIVSIGGARLWSDGTFAQSCKGYRAPAAGYTYTGQTGDGLYQIDPDGIGGIAAFNVYCDMTTDGGGWTIFYSATGADGTLPLVSNTEVSNDPFQAAAYNLSVAKKIAISAVSTTSIIWRSPTVWLKWNAPFFDSNLSVANSHTHTNVTLTSSSNETAAGVVGWSNFGYQSGGDFGITDTGGFDHHNTSTYNHLNTSCVGHYFYSYSNGAADSDAAYKAKLSLGNWGGVAGCDGSETGFSFRAMMR